MFRKIAWHFKKKREQKELLAACQNKPSNLRTFGKITAKWGIQLKLGDQITLGANTVFSEMAKFKSVQRSSSKMAE
jgi:hypothetical protein